MPSSRLLGTNPRALGTNPRSTRRIFETKREVKLSRLEALVRQFFKIQFPQEDVIYNHRPDWLKNPITGFNLELDLYFPNLKLGVEANGYGHEENYQRWKDGIKEALCLKKGVKLLTIDQLGILLQPDWIYSHGFHLSLPYSLIQNISHYSRFQERINKKKERINKKNRKKPKRKRRNRLGKIHRLVDFGCKQYTKPVLPDLHPSLTGCSIFTPSRFAVDQASKLARMSSRRESQANKARQEWRKLHPR